MKNLPGFAATAALAIVIGLILLGGGVYVAMNPEILKAPETAEVERSASIDESSLVVSSVSATLTGTATGVDSVRVWYGDKTEGFWTSDPIAVVDGKWSVTPPASLSSFDTMSSFYVSVKDASKDWNDPEATLMEVATIRIEGRKGISPNDKVSVAWKIEPLGVDGPGKAEVTAIINGQEHLVGTFPGTCAEIGSEGSAVSELLTAEGEVAGVTCYYAGSGDEIGIFKTDTGLSIRTGEIAEPTAESPEFRGNFTTKLDLKLMQ